VPLRKADAEGLMDGIPDELRYSAAHLLLPDGEMVSGAEAMVGLFAVLPGGRLLSSFVAGWGPSRRFSEFLYSVVSRLHSTSGCRSRN
jgi:hypothetical protein